MSDQPLEGDPDVAPMPLYLNTSAFVAQTAQECRLIADLINAGRTDEAWNIAAGRQVKAEQLLKHLEVPALPSVDVLETKDATKRESWRTK